MENKEQPLVELKAMDKGPLLVKGPVKLITPDGKEMIMERTAICRCGHSKNQPFCDGSHMKL
ncbi:MULTISPECIES: CDGSH iron-sulfur domain-containing protein [Parabacteroides]|jgi:hypothetical protein|uniref:CDGSH-type Zn-finger protein n=1 Tax=Parabacteroides faecis TaxID=1217282 RepID=A0ABR6KPN6_9BACT|nr:MULTISPECIES: CDGSH iron-sulfur domain-containing protein [Parabacteroides]MBB4623467.1 CDGSH-type Zn-finger protein [Parabacteroides faecis]MBC8620707.1 CDGSH iron-sulfur domain-containing protein [Parabacteroides faecis]MCL3852249.1 CDGSH iron-sulfur domain-containing protein [Parabacteroides leei]MCS2893203.1 CDGSH iron-sulfur domain-containing protein [Parabacteroides faecis]RHR43180.1 CDGSH iron-sulfur domain-containing protein [Parabacteroides sp. AF18-52]